METLLQPTSFFFDGLSQGIELVRNVPMKHCSLSLAYFAGTELSTVDFPHAWGRELEETHLYSWQISSRTGETQCAQVSGSRADAPGGFARRPGVLGALQLPAEADKLWRAFHWEAAAGSGELLASWKLLSFQKTEKSFCSIWIKPKFCIYIYIYIFKPLHFQGTGNTAFQPALLDSFIGLCHNKSEVRRNRKALLSNNRGWGSGKGGLNQRQACWVTVLPAEHKIHVPEAWSKSRGYKALHLTAPQSRTNQGASLESEVLCPEQSLVSSDGRTLDYFSGISEQMLLASYGCLPTYGALLCHQTLPKIQSSFWQQRTVFIYHENWSGLGSQFCKLFISCQ